MEKRVFLKRIQACCKKLNMAEFLRVLFFSLSISAIVGIIFQTVAFFVPFYQAGFYSICALIIGGLTAGILLIKKRKTMRQAALYMDQFEFQERIVTAYEHLDEEDEILLLQRKDAMEQLERYGNRIRIPLFPGKKSMLIMSGLLAIMVVMMLLPAEMKEKAKNIHLIENEAEEKIEEVENVLESLEELAQENLSQEQLEELQEMMESLQSTMQEYEQVDSREMLDSANQKLDYKYNNMSKQLGKMAKALESGATPSVMTADSMKELASQMQENSSTPSTGEMQLAGNQDQSGNLSESGQTGDSSDSSQSGNPSDGNQSGNQSGNQQNSGQNGQGGNNQNSQGNSQSGGSSGSNAGESGSAQGNGTGEGDSDGQEGGFGGGDGRGEGSGSMPHDYVSIPNEIIDSENLTGVANGHENSEFFREQNGLSWTGTHVSHEKVLGTYEKNAYEGIAAGKYPSGMEDVIKDYFASFN